LLFLDIGGERQHRQVVSFGFELPELLGSGVPLVRFLSTDSTVLFFLPSYRVEVWAERSTDLNHR
jgi:hypothetical protein